MLPSLLLVAIKLTRVTLFFENDRLDTDVALDGERETNLSGLLAGLATVCLRFDILKQSVDYHRD